MPNFYVYVMYESTVCQGYFYKRNLFWWGFLYFLWHLILGVLEDTKLFQNVSGPQSLHDKLKDGVILCKLMNKIKPGSIKKYSQKPIAPFQKMENISFFNQAMREYNVKPDYVFVTTDLFQKKNMVQVLIGLRALGTRATEEGVKPEISI